MDDAPDFGDGYPSKGKMIGPAWRTAWPLLSKDRWTDRRDLVDPVLAVVDVQPQTLFGLLRKATAIGVLSVEKTRHPDGMIFRYRINDPLPSQESLTDLAAAHREHVHMARVLREAGYKVVPPHRLPKT